MKRFATLFASLAALFAGAVSAGAQSSDPLAGDARLSAKRSVRELSMPVRDLLANLNEQTGISFFADPSVADDKLTVIAHEKPIGDTLRGVANLTRTEWVRSGKPGEYGYTLRVGEAERARRSKARDERLTRLAGVVVRQAATYGDFQLLGEPQRDALADSLPQKIAAEKDPERQQTLRIQYAALRELRERNRFRPFVYRFIAQLGKEETLGILLSGATTYSWPEAPGCKPLPKEILRSLQQGVVIDGISSGSPGDIVSARVRFTAVDGRSGYLRWDLIIGRRNFYLSGLSGIVGLPSYDVDAMSGDPEGPTAPADWEKDATLSAKMDVVLPADENPGQAGQRTRSHNLSEALERIDKARPLDVISDALWSTQLAGSNMTQLPVGDVLTKLARITGHRWWKQDGFVVVRSQYYDADREAEPPATAVTRWVAQYERGIFNLDDLSEIAMLPYAQAATLQDMNMKGVFPVFISPLSAGRTHLQLWNSLSLPQRRKAAKSGIAFAELNPSQQALYVLAASDTNMPIRASVLDDKGLTKSRMRLETRETSQWGVRRVSGTHGWQVPREGTEGDSGFIPRAEALKRFQALDASIKLEEVQPMTRTSVLFLCEDDRGLLSTFFVELPPRWGG